MCWSHTHTSICNVFNSRIYKCVVPKIIWHWFDRQTNFPLTVFAERLTHIYEKPSPSEIRNSRTVEQWTSRGLSVSRFSPKTPHTYTNTLTPNVFFFNEHTTHHRTHQATFPDSKKTSTNSKWFTKVTSTQPVGPIRRGPSSRRTLWR